MSVKDKQPAFGLQPLKHLKPQDHIQICTDLVPKNKAPLKSAWLPPEPVQQSSGRPRFESKSLARSWDNVCWLSEMTRPIFPRGPPRHFPTTLKSPSSRPRQGYNWALKNRVMCSELQTENACLNKSWWHISPSPVVLAGHSWAAVTDKHWQTHRRAQINRNTGKKDVYIWVSNHVLWGKCYLLCVYESAGYKKKINK